jgi:hypothetical protein
MADCAHGTGEFKRISNGERAEIARKLIEGRQPVYALRAMVHRRGRGMGITTFLRGTDLVVL